MGDNDDLKTWKEEKRALSWWLARRPWGVPTPKIAIVLFPKYSHGFPIHCLDRFAHPDDDDLYPPAENKEDMMISVMMLFGKAGG